MSSSDFSKVLIRDERLDCHDSIPFAVYRSGSNVTVATFDAISQSASSIVFNVQVPSETTVLDRRVIWESTLDFDVEFTSNAASVGVQACEYGLKQSFCPWPLHALCNTQQATINNNSVTINTSDVLPALSRMHDMRELQRYNGMAPTKVDSAQNAASLNGAISNVLSSYLNVAMDNDWVPRGALQVSVSYKLVNNVSDAGLIVAASTATKYHVQATFREPLLMSPFLYAHPFYNGQGFYGLQNLNLVFNLNGGIGAGLWRVMDNSAYVNKLYSEDGATGLTIAPTISNFGTTNNRLIFNFLTPKPSDLLAARNVVPYWEMPRYLKSAAVSFDAYTNNGVLAPTEPTTKIVQSQSLQLNQVPDKLIIFFRPNSLTSTDSNRSLIISKISINWNNQSGILASATTDQLWRYSVEAGSQQTWEEYSGVANVGQPGLGQVGAAGAGNGNYFKQQIPMVGSYLMLDFAKHINITEDYYAPGSLGNFNLQFTLTTASNRPVATGDMDLVLITVNSGLFVTEKGQSATYTGILTKDDVLSASAMQPHSDAEARRLVGGFSLGSLLNTAKKIAGTAQKYLPAIEAASGLLPEGKLKSQIQSALPIASKVAKHVQGMGTSGGMYGRGKGSQVFRMEDRLV